MTQQTSGRAAAAGNATRDEASAVGHTAADAGRQVAGTATEQVTQVTREARRQAKDLLGEARQQVTQQARAGQQRAGDGIRALAGELHGMAEGAQDRGPASDLAAQAAGRLEDVAAWLDLREPGELLDEFRGLARRRPGAFLLGAATLGVLAGRLTRGVRDAQQDTGPTGGYATPAYPTPYPAAPAAYPAGGAGFPPPAPVPGYPASGSDYGQAPYGPGGTGAPYTGDLDPGTVPLPDSPGTGPAHAPRPGATTVGEHLEEFGRGPADGSRP